MIVMYPYDPSLTDCAIGMFHVVSIYNSSTTYMYTRILLRWNVLNIDVHGVCSTACLYEGHGMAM